MSYPCNAFKIDLSLDPDNYTDPPTFLSHLQRNPRLVPYDFWPLVADSTVIVQHVCSVAIFVCCFVGIYQERISPIAVVGCGSTATIFGWLLWDMWIGQDEPTKVQQETAHQGHGEEKPAGDNASMSSTLSSIHDANHTQTQGLGLMLPSPSSSTPSRNHSRNPSALSLHTTASAASSARQTTGTGVALANSAHLNGFETPLSSFSPRNQQRLETIKSAVLIYCALLGLSPILKSLTKSTTSDSIWAMSAWLMGINVFFFDYGGGVGVKYRRFPHYFDVYLANATERFPASLSTNAALMASTVLASRLTSTTHVFSLTVFSIEVFGLFPVFRRHLRHHSWKLHVTLTVLLILTAGAGLGITLVGGGSWKAAIAGIVFWGLGNALAMGGCSWWLIGLQKYKNVVIGPWDPARPILRAGEWD